MKTPRWIVADDDGVYDDKPIPHSGGEGKQLKGFDARNRDKTPLRKMGEPAPVRKWTKKYL